MTTIRNNLSNQTFSASLFQDLKQADSKQHRLPKLPRELPNSGHLVGPSTGGMRPKPSDKLSIKELIKNLFGHLPNRGPDKGAPDSSATPAPVVTPRPTPAPVEGTQTSPAPTTPPTAETAPAPGQTPPKDKGVDMNNLKEDLNNSLRTDDRGRVSEEQLYAGLVEHLVKNEGGKDARNKFHDAFKKHLEAAGPRASHEEAADAALQDLVKSGVISKETAKQIKEKAFSAAQLDTNYGALFDGKGGNGDDTVAVRKKDRAISNAIERLTDILAGRSPKANQAEAHDSPKRTRALSSTAAHGTKALASSSHHDSGAPSSEFLWKPASDKNGAAVILFPAAYASQVKSASVVAPNGSKIEEGSYAGIGNGQRAHFRLSRAGSAYPSGSTVVLELKTGERREWTIQDTSRRTTAR